MQDNRVQELIDRNAIMEVRHRYGRALDARNWEEFADLFTEEVDADFSAWGIPKERVTRQRIVEWMQPAFRRVEMRSQQIYTNFVITVRGDAASSTSSLVGLHHIPGFAGGEDFVLHAEYTDQLRREGNQWKIIGLTLRVLFTTGNLAIVAA